MMLKKLHNPNDGGKMREKKKLGPLVNCAKSASNHEQHHVQHHAAERFKQCKRPHRIAI